MGILRGLVRDVLLAMVLAALVFGGGPAGADDPVLANFALAMERKGARQVVGVYVEGVLAHEVWQQPYDAPAFVFNQDHVVTEFRAVRDLTGNVGLLAHNNLAGALFFRLGVGDVVHVIFGDGAVVQYAVVEMREYAVVDAHQLRDVETGEVLGVENVFYEMYGGDVRAVLQTCIRRGDNPDWGRLFVIARPVGGLT
jgi:hypothetical protein